MRALVRDPQVIILDEATSQLDVNTTHAVSLKTTRLRNTVLGCLPLVGDTHLSREETPGGAE